MWVNLLTKPKRKPKNRWQRKNWKETEISRMQGKSSNFLPMKASLMEQCLGLLKSVRLLFWLKSNLRLYPGTWPMPPLMSPLMNGGSMSGYLENSSWICGIYFFPSPLKARSKTTRCCLLSRFCSRRLPKTETWENAIRQPSHKHLFPKNLNGMFSTANHYR